LQETYRTQTYRTQTYCGVTCGVRLLNAGVKQANNRQ